MVSKDYEDRAFAGDARTRVVYRRLVCECIKELESDGYRGCAELLREKFEINDYEEGC